MLLCICILSGCLFIYVVVSAFTGYMTMSFFSHPKVNDFEKEHKELMALGFDAEHTYNAAVREDFIVNSFDGYEIHSSLLRFSDNDSSGQESKKLVVIAHGYVGNRYTSMAYAKVFLELGFNCVIFDERNHGENKKSFTSMGYYEEQDVRSVLNASLDILGKQDVIGLLGISMGAASVLMAAPKIENLNFLVSDSAFSSLYGLINHRMQRFKSFHLYHTLTFCNWFVKLFYGYSMKNISPNNSVQQLKEDLSVLFIHSQADKVVPFSMFEALYSAKKGIKQSFVSETAHHAKMIFSETEKYKATLQQFLG